MEDLAGASFAGLYESYLDVADPATLRRRIQDCRASAKTPRVRSYLSQAGLAEASVGLSVLVQQMVDARVAGVGFSIAPDSGREEHCLIECCSGLSEHLLSGHVKPSRYVVCLESGAVIEEEPGADGAMLSELEIRSLSALLLEIQARFGCPQDVEWAIDRKGALKLVQSRPVTKVQWRSDVEELSNADLKDGGISAQVCTPLMFSLYRNAMEESFQSYFEQIKLRPRRASPEKWLFHYYGRAYWNASAVKRALASIPGFSELEFDRGLGIQKKYSSAGPLKVPFNLRTLARALPVALALAASYRRQLQAVDVFRSAFAPVRDRYLAKIETLDSTSDGDFFADLERVLHDFHGWTERTYFTTVYNNSNAQTDFKGFLDKLDGATGGHTSLVILIGGLSDVTHMEMQRGVRKLFGTALRFGTASPVWRQDLASFLGQNYFHADSELDLMAPRWGEVSDRVREMVEAMLGTGTEPADPDRAAAKQRRAYLQAVEEVDERLRAHWIHGLRFRRGFRKRLRRVRSYLRRREEMRECSMQCYYVVRRYLLEAGKRLARSRQLPEPEDVFMLHTQEISRLLRRELKAPEVERRIVYRRKMYDGYRHFTAPNEFGGRVEQRDARAYLEISQGRLVLQGTGCSAGRVEGTVRVIRSLAEAHRLRKGDVLVTRFTDPGWTPALGLVSAVVTEVGGLLSHAAVIGREYGIPAVLNLPGATQVLRSGQRVVVDGSSGRVTLLDESRGASRQETGRRVPAA
jgi:phosphohistidine swiveling domain-containing protein